MQRAWDANDQHDRAINHRHLHIGGKRQLCITVASVRLWPVGCKVPFVANSDEYALQRSLFQPFRLCGLEGCQRRSS